MKNYIKPQIIEEEVIVEDVIAASNNYVSKSFGDMFNDKAETINW